MPMIICVHERAIQIKGCNLLNSVSVSPLFELVVLTVLPTVVASQFRRKSVVCMLHCTWQRGYPPFPSMAWVAFI